MVPNLTAILQRLTGEWATLLQPDAILAKHVTTSFTSVRNEADRVGPP